MKILQACQSERASFNSALCFQPKDLFNFYLIHNNHLKSHLKSSSGWRTILVTTTISLNIMLGGSFHHRMRNFSTKLHKTRSYNKSLQAVWNIYCWSDVFAKNKNRNQTKPQRSTFSWAVNITALFTTGSFRLWVIYYSHTMPCLQRSSSRSFHLLLIWLPWYYFSPNSVIMQQPFLHHTADAKHNLYPHLIHHFPL